MRSPYGVPRNLFNKALIPGGSSSGSAIAVAAGLVPLALGTDTAGSGRVPAGLGNIVGLKPSLGLVSTAGVVPACRTLDCVSLFALTVDDAFGALAAMAGPDAADPYSRPRPLGVPGALPQGVRLGVPLPGQRLFFGDQASAAAYDAALAGFAELGAEIVEIDIEPFYETARLLYEGPWVAERYITARKLIASAPESMHPVTRQIILSGARPSAVDAFAAFYELEELRRVRDHVFRRIDAMVLPTIPAAYTIEQVLADPIGLNSRLGTYTNFVNLLDLCALAVPAAMHNDGTPFGVTLLALAGHDAALASIGRVFHADTGLPLGATNVAQPPLAPISKLPADGEIAVAVVGAHLSGMPLNGELKAFGARFLEKAATAADYRLFALAGTTTAETGTAAGDGRRRHRHRHRDLGDAVERIRPLRRRRAAAAVDRHAGHGRRPQGEGLSGGGRGHIRRPRHFRLRRLARVHGAGVIRSDRVHIPFSGWTGGLRQTPKPPATPPAFSTPAGQP